MDLRIGFAYWLLRNGLLATRRVRSTAMAPRSIAIDLLKRKTARLAARITQWFPRLKFEIAYVLGCGTRSATATGSPPARSPHGYWSTPIAGVFDGHIDLRPGSPEPHRHSARDMIVRRACQELEDPQIQMTQMVPGFDRQQDDRQQTAGGPSVGRLRRSAGRFATTEGCVICG
jgi:hypothetical protein